MANQSNPLYPTYSPSPYIDANGNPTTDPGTTTPAAVAAPATNVNIDPNAGRPQNPYGTVGEPAVNNQSGQQSGGNTGAPQQQQPSQGGVQLPSLDHPAGANGNYTVDQILTGPASQVRGANDEVNRIWGQIKPLQDKYNALSTTDQQAIAGQQITSQLNSLYGNLATAENTLNAAQKNYSDTLGKAIDTVTLTPEQQKLYSAQADKATSDSQYAAAQAKVLTDGAQSQRDLAAAQTGYQAAAARAQDATAQATAAKTPAEAAALTAQASRDNATAASTNAMIGPLVDKTRADTTLTQAQAGLADANSDLARANIGKVNADANLSQAQADYQRGMLTAGGPAATVGATQAQAGLYGAEATGQLAGAAGTLADIQQKLLGPGLYGMQDRINAIRAIQDQVFGPGGSGTPGDRTQQATDLLQQYVGSSIAGTTPYEANIAAANAGLTAFGTQASMFNAAQQALASRANALAGLGGNVLSTLGTMNANAPAGSTAMAGAFKDVIDYMANKAAAQAQSMPGGVQAVQQPQAPQLPALLQRLAPGGASAVTGGVGPAGAQPMPNMAGGPGLGAAQPMPNAGGQTAPMVNMGNSNINPTTGQPWPTFNPTPANPAPQTSAPVTINIGGQGQQQSPAPPPGGYAQNQPGTYGALTGSMPAMLQQYAPPTTDFVHQLWGNELQSGAVKSPYAQQTGVAPVPTPQVPPVPSPMG